MARPQSDVDRETADLGLALDHAWAWFVLHAGQRLQLVNFLLLSVAFVLAAYGAALGSGNRIAAGGIALLGALVSVGFWRLELRTRELLKAVEEPLADLQRRVADRVGLPTLSLVERVKTPARRYTSYADVIRFLALVSALALVAAAVYAFGFATDVSHAP